MFINDVYESFEHVNFLMFADDLKLFYKISNHDDAMKLQNDFTRLIDWCTNNKLKLNITKCFSMSYFRHSNPIQYNYFGNSVKLKCVSQFKDLGVTFDQSLQFSYHITNITNSALKLLGFIIRNTKDFKNIFSIKNLFCSIVRSRLEYASPVWSPYQKLYIDRLERVQRKFLRYVGYKLNIPLIDISYDYLFLSLNLLPLHLRREQSDLLLLHNIINSNIDCSELLELISFNINTHNTRKPLLFSIPLHKTNYLMYSGMSRILKTGNSHLDLDLFCCSKSTIKTHFYKHFSSEGYLMV